MLLREAKKILKENGYIFEEYQAPKSTIDYWEEVKAIDPNALEELKEIITDIALDANITRDDYGNFVNMDDWDPREPHDAVYENIFDAIGWEHDCFYDDLVNELGTPEEFVKGLNNG